MFEADAEQLQRYADLAVEAVLGYAPKVLLAIVVLVVGLWLIKRVVRLLEAGLNRRSTDETLNRFLMSVTSVGLKALLLVSVASMVGIETTSLIAVLGAAGLAVGLALQGSLSNFAGGVLVLLFRPYKVGDFVELEGVSGTVKAIQIFNTVLNTPDNKLVIVPNGLASNGVITNYSTEETRRVDFVFGIDYGDSVSQARGLIEQVVAGDQRIMQDPAPLIVLSELADSSVNLTVRVWVASSDYWGVYFQVLEQVKEAFDSNGISIPYPQQVVHRVEG